MRSSRLIICRCTPSIRPLGRAFFESDGLASLLTVSDIVHVWVIVLQEVPNTGQKSGKNVFRGATILICRKREFWRRF